MQGGTFPFPEFVIFMMLGDIPPPPTLPYIGGIALYLPCPGALPPGLVPLSPTGYVHRARLAVALLPLKRSDLTATCLLGASFPAGTGL